MSTVDIRIMASPKRKEKVERLLKLLDLPESQVTWDDRPEGGDCTYTALKTWLTTIPEGVTHRVVLNDDVFVCDNFKEIVEQIAATHPHKAVTFINWFDEVDMSKVLTPYYRITVMPGCGLMLPKEVIEPCMEWIENYPDEKLKKIDDVMISKYCDEHNIMMITTLPCIVQHPDDESLLPIQYNWKRTSKNYDQLGRGDWTNKSIMPGC